MRKTILILLAVSLTAFAASKTTAKFGNPSAVPQSDKEFQYETRTKFNKSVDDVDTLFDLTTGLSADVITKSSAVLDSAKITSIRDDQLRRFLGVTEKHSITVYGAFDTSAANTTEQSYAFDTLPALARIMDAWLICTDSVQIIADSTNQTMGMELGTASGGAQLSATADVDADDDVGAMAILEAYDLAPANAVQILFLTGTPGGNWNTLWRGSWDIYIQYIDNESY